MQPRSITILAGILAVSFLTTACGGGAAAPTAVPAVPTKAPAVATTVPAVAPTTAPAAPTKASAPTTVAAPTAAAQAPAGDVAAGKTVFDQNCNACHPGGDKGVGPALKGRNLTADTIRTTVRSGKGAMPPFSSAQISDPQLNNLVAYVQSLK